MLIDWKVQKPGLWLGLGNSVDYEGEADFVFSHLYGPLPAHLIGLPIIANQIGTKKEAERWAGCKLAKVGEWGRRIKNEVYVGNMESRPIDLDGLIEEEIRPGIGFFPLELVLRLLVEFSWLGALVFDGFMGRGTVGKAALELGMEFVGIDIDHDRVKMAQAYLGCSP